MGKGAAEGVDKLAGTVMGKEAKEETAHAIDTIARYDSNDVTHRFLSKLIFVQVAVAIRSLSIRGFDYSRIQKAAKKRGNTTISSLIHA